MKLIRQILPLILIAMLFGCKKPPEFPTTPQIAFERIEKHTILRLEGLVTKKIDSIGVAINFKDGDGDLGTNQEDKINFYSRILLKKGNKFVDAIDSVTTPYTDKTNTTRKKVLIDRNGRFMPLNPDNKKRPIEGTLYQGFSMNLGIATSEPEYIVKFQIHIVDNAGRQSNVIETSEVKVNLYSY